MSITLRCTRKLLARLRPASTMEPRESTTALGDWYANLLFTRPSQTILLISERSFLPVVLEARGIDTLVPRFQRAAKEMLSTIGVPESAVTQELQHMADVYVAPTKSRVVLGMMNDFAFQIECLLIKHPEMPLLDIALNLSTCPCSPLKMENPGCVTREILKRGENNGFPVT